MTEPIENPAREFQTEHLILLVGGNPLPNYVAGMLLAAESGTVHLVHTKHTREKGGTFEIAKRLGAALQRDGANLNTILYETDETDGGKIFETINTILNKVKTPARVGLNYTGGTKPMVRHAARALAARVQEFPNPVYSYLDARTLQMVIERAEEKPLYKFVRDAVQPGLVKLFDLHGYVIGEPRQMPKQFDICDSLRALYVTEQGRTAWRKYLKDSQLRRLPDQNDSALLNPIGQKLRALDSGTPPNLTNIANQFGYNELPKAKEFFEGKWLEEYALQKLSAASSALGITDFGIDMLAKKPAQAVAAMQLDLAAMYGYQLFAISCMATTDPEKAQEHFFEIYVRASQVGGDEARFALVCLLEPPQVKNLREKIHATWDPEEKVRVFGAQDLANLDVHFKNWLEKANEP